MKLLPVETENRTRGWGRQANVPARWMESRSLAATRRRGTRPAWPLIAVLLVATRLTLPAAGQSSGGGQAWPQWRGPTRDGVLPEQHWPDKLSDDTFQRVWRVELGPSYSGPITDGQRIYVTETRDKKFEVVRALDRASGQQLWEAQWEGALTVPFFAAANGSWIRATPALDLDDGRLFVAGMRDLLVCLDAVTGRQIWQVDFVQQLQSPVPSFGFVSSPLVSGDHLFVQAGGAFLKLDKRTGQIVWKTLADGGGMEGSAFSSPILATLAGRPQLLVQTRTRLAGVAADDGQVLWSQEIPAFRGMNILTPTVHENAVFSSSYGGRSLLVGVAADGDKLVPSERWTNPAQGYMSSPVVIDGHAYLHLRNQRFTCIDLARGTTRWTTIPYGKYWSLVASGGKILALDQKGELLLIQADPAEFKLLDSRKISDEETWAHLAVSGPFLLVRERNAMAVYRWRTSAAAATGAE